MFKSDNPLYDGYVVAYTNLHEAAVGGSARDLDVFIHEGQDVNERNEAGKTPLHNAAYFGNPRNVKALIDRGADIEAKDWHGRTPLHLACTHHPLSHELSTMTRFFGAENRGYRYSAAVLLDCGATLEAKDGDGWTPLHHAA